MTAGTRAGGGGPSGQRDFERRLEARQRRKLRALRQGDRSVWFGLGTFGIVGWLVTIPAVALTALGVWLDRRWPVPFSWALTLLVTGVALGCFNAWRWVSQERRIIERELQESGEEAPPAKERGDEETGNGSTAERGTR
jgi:ATP synthase protein I